MQTSSIRFRSRNSQEDGVVRFFGPDIAVNELEALIAEKLGLGRSTSARVVLVNGLTGDALSDSAARVARNSFVIAHRKPVPRQLPARVQRVLKNNPEGYSPTCI